MFGAFICLKNSNSKITGISSSGSYSKMRSDKDKLEHKYCGEHLLLICVNGDGSYICKNRLLNLVYILGSVSNDKFEDLWHCDVKNECKFNMIWRFYELLLFGYFGSKS